MARLEDLTRGAERIEHLAMAAVMAAERHRGFEPRDVGADRCGYDIESRVPPGGQLRFIEVKGRRKDGKTITVTRNEIMTALNKPEAFVLAIVLVGRGRRRRSSIRSAPIPERARLWRDERQLHHRRPAGTGGDPGMMVSS